MSDESSNMRAAVKLCCDLRADAEYYRDTQLHDNVEHICRFLEYLEDSPNNISDMKTQDPAEHARLRALFTETQWPDSPVEVAKVISGESDVSKKIPDDLLKYLRHETTSDTARKDFLYYLAYMALLLDR